MWKVDLGVTDQSIQNVIVQLNLIKKNVVNATYDCYGLLHWNGGFPLRRVSHLSPNDYIARIINMNNLNIGVYFTFDNLYIKETDLDDKLGNYFLEKAHNPLNGILCNNELLLNYIKKNYPKYKIIGSNNYSNNSIDDLKRRQDLYDIILLPTSMNNNYDVIKQLDTAKLEIIVTGQDHQFDQLQNELMNKWNYSHHMDDLIPFLEISQLKESKEPNNLLSKFEIEKLKSFGIRSFRLQNSMKSSSIMTHILQCAILKSNESVFSKWEMAKALPKKLIMKKLIFDN